MKFKMVTEKVNSFTLNGKIINVSGLPEIIRNEVDTLDRIAQERLDKVYELEVLDLALSTKKLQVMQLVKSHVEKIDEDNGPVKNEPTETNEVNEEK